MLIFECVYSKSTFVDTTDGFHWFLVFDTPILNAYMANGATIDAKPYGMVWGASDRLLPMYAASNPDIVRTYYFPYERDVELSRDLEYWKAHHPDWIVYKCDKVSPAYMAGEPLRVPLDISNPQVIDWQVQTFSAAARFYGYDGLAADNYAFGNAIGACGVYQNGVWVQKYSGEWQDAAFTTDSVNWISTFYQRLKAAAPEIIFGINFSLNDLSPSDANVATVFQNIDYLVDEAGFTQWGGGLPNPDKWNNIATMIDTIQAGGKHYFGINEFAVLSPSAKEWAMASYMMCKNARSSMVVTSIQNYGTLTQLVDYDALNIGSPTEKRYLSNGAYFRHYSNGLVVLNPYTTAATFTLPDGWQYRDAYGNTYGSSKTVTLAAQSGLVLGATSSPAGVSTPAPTSAANPDATTAAGGSGSPASNNNPPEASTTVTGRLSQQSINETDSTEPAAIKRTSAGATLTASAYAVVGCAAAIALLF